MSIIIIILVRINIMKVINWVCEVFDLMNCLVCLVNWLIIVLFILILCFILFKVFDFKFSLSVIWVLIKVLNLVWYVESKLMSLFL